MLEDIDRERIALFFYFAFLNESLTRQCSLKALRDIRRAKRLQTTPSYFTDRDLVATTSRVFESGKKKQAKHRSVSLVGVVNFPQSVDLGVWQQLQRSTSDDERLAVIWSKLRSVSDEDISDGLGVTVGTVRHRVARGLRALGVTLSEVTAVAK